MEVRTKKKIKKNKEEKEKKKKEKKKLRGNRETDQRLCFRYTDATLPLLLKSEISSF